MEKLIEKVGSYHILNFLLPGIVFCFLCKEILSVTFIDYEKWYSVFLYYAFGLIISRIGALLIEPLLRKMKLVHFVEYPRYVKAAQKDSKIEALMEMNNLYRSLLAVFLMFGVTVGIYFLITFYPIMRGTVIGVSMLLVLVLLIASFKRQSEFIVNRVLAQENNKE